MDLTYLVSRREVNLLSHSTQSPQDYGNTSSTTSTFFSHSIQSCCITSAHLIIEINEVICSLRPLTLNVYRLQLFTLIDIQLSCVVCKSDADLFEQLCCWLHSFEPPFQKKSYQLSMVAINMLCKSKGRLHTSKPRFKSAIFLEYSRSPTRTLFSICSVFACTSLRMAMSLSTAASKVRMKGWGSNATETIAVKLNRGEAGCNIRPLLALDWTMSFSETDPTNSATSNLPYHTYGWVLLGSSWAWPWIQKDVDVARPQCRVVLSFEALT